jgi:ubiquinol-cytochrome c reductase iron-sulfur subunit
MRVRRWLVALATLLFGWITRRRQAKEDVQPGERIVPEGTPERRAENVVVALLAIAALFAIGFIVTYAEFSPHGMPNELLGICLGMSFAFIAAALGVLAKRLVVSEDLEHDYPPEGQPQEQEEIAEIVEQSGSRITRKRLLLGAGAAAGGALGLATLTPALSLGPLWDTDPLYQAPWRRGVRLIGQDGHPYSADEIEQETFYTAFPEGANPELIGAPIVLARLAPSSLRLPSSRASWAPDGIVAYSKICTHAGCAIALYRKPTFPVVEPRPAFVCPCHYSTFDPSTGGTVIYGPAGRPLPQLPVMIDAAGMLRAAGNFSGPVGPSWGGVRTGKAKD